MEWPLSGVADRNRRCSKRSARPRIAFVNWLSTAQREPLVGRGVMGLVEDQQRARPEVAQKVAQSADIGLIRHQRMGDEETRTCCPRVCATSALAPQDRKVISVVECEREAELRLKLFLPLADHAGRRGQQNEIDPPPQQEFAQDESRFDSLARPDVVGISRFNRGRRSAFRRGSC